MLRILKKVYLEGRTHILIFLVIIFVIGIIFGAVAVSRLQPSLNRNLYNTFSSFISSYDSINYENSVLINELAAVYYSSLLIIWLLGLSVVVMPLIPCWILIKGFAFGFSIAFLTRYFQLKGVLLSILGLLPQNLISIPVYIMAGVIAISFSLRVIGYFRGRNQLSLVDFIDYSLKMLLLGIILFVSILLEVFVSPFLFEKILQFF